MNYPVRILCVESDKDWCELMKLMFRLSGDDYQITSVSAVSEALVLIENLSFDFYILEYFLPDDTGIELCRKIRRTDKTTPILFYSGMAREIDRQTAIAAGATEYLVKPDDLDNFMITIKKLLSEKAAVPQDKSADKAKAYNSIF